MNLLLQVGKTVIKTEMSKKVTLNGQTQILPVYQIPLDCLFYNEQNDRIASWISEYSHNVKQLTIDSIEKNEFNSIIENFIIESNPESIDKTTKNIHALGQREPGVVLNDGRIIDGNRRFTCLRRINKIDPEVQYFEAIIIDSEKDWSKKNIKLLELSIQHGEEKRVDYNNIEKLIGIYKDVVETELLTIEEYATSINEKLSEVQRKVDASKIMVEFLDYINFPKQYHIVREYQLVSSISDYINLIKTIYSKELKEQIKKSYFLYVLLNAIGPGREFFKYIKLINEHGFFNLFYKEILEVEEYAKNRILDKQPRNYSELRHLVRVCDDLTFHLKNVLEDYSDSSKRQELYKKPTQIVSKAISSLKEIDVNVLNTMNEEQKQKLKTNISFLRKTINSFSGIDGLQDEVVLPTEKEDTKALVHIKPKETEIRKDFIIIPSKREDFLEIDGSEVIVSANYYCRVKKPIGNEEEYILFFVDDKGLKVSNEATVVINNLTQSVKFELASKTSKLKEIYLAVRKKTDRDSELRFLLKYDVKMMFSLDL